ncbi:MAG TPA: alpha/beta fold hydrolase [Candidatus Saccharimonadales bacterium]|nr:alpha/beta fold hydrolase [Candidatus Saccharimonadales bacterium]
MSKLSKLLFVIFIIVCCILAVVFLVQKYKHKKASLPQLPKAVNPLTIQAMRNRTYSGSDITIEQTLPDGTNYHQYITSYTSDGLKIYALLTVPLGDKPKNGWPVILFNHGYIAPETYQTNPSVGQYATYLPVFARNGYIVFKPDYRGNGNSEGKPEGAYYSNAYIVDDLNALASIQKYKDANPNKLGIWAHSLGGNVTLKDLVIEPNAVKAAVIWGGVVGSYNDLLYNWQRKVPFHPSSRQLALRNNYRQELIKQYGDPKTNPAFWNSIDPAYFVKDITAPVQLDVGGSDEEVPVSFSQSLRDKLQEAGKTVEYYEYPGDNHNISANFNLAMQHSLEFFDKYLK